MAVISWANRENDPGAVTNELHVVDLATGVVQDLGRVAGYARSPVWWADGATWHVAYLAEPDPFGGFVVYDTVPGASAPPHDLTTGMDVTPNDLAQVADGPPLALFERGLDTEIHRLDPAPLRFRCLFSRALALDGLLILPAGRRRADGPFPLVTLVHGGPDDR